MTTDEILDFDLDRPYLIIHIHIHKNLNTFPTGDQKVEILEILDAAAETANASKDAE